MLWLHCNQSQARGRKQQIKLIIWVFFWHELSTVNQRNISDIFDNVEFTDI